MNGKRQSSQCTEHDESTRNGEMRLHNYKQSTRNIISDWTCSIYQQIKRQYSVQVRTTFGANSDKAPEQQLYCTIYRNIRSDFKTSNKNI
jgi:hypothetical protein